MSTPSDSLRAMIAALGSLPSDLDDADRIDCLRQLESLRGAVTAAQARITEAFVTSQRAAQETAGVPVSRVGRGTAAQVALARRISPFQAERWIGFSMIAEAELPDTFAALQRGETSEWRAILLARETAWLSREHRGEVDRALAPRLSALGDKATGDAARRLAYGLDPRGYTSHLANAPEQRHVSLRPAPDVMTRLSALLPLTEGVAVHVALSKAADSARAAGDPRTRGQVMADTLVERCTGQAQAGDVGVEVQVVVPADVLFADVVGPADDIVRYRGMSAADLDVPDDAVHLDGTDEGPAGDTDPSAPADRPGRREFDNPDGDVAESLTAARRRRRRQRDDRRERRQQLVDNARRARRARPARDRRDEPALLLGYGPIPASMARSLILDRSAFAPTWLRRVYACPDTGELVAMESRRRRFTAAQQAFISTRDQVCRTPFCGAPIRHFDHVDPWERTKLTRVRDGDGLCEACNYAKQAPGWATEAVGSSATCPDLIITTPTGHTYRTAAPRVLWQHTPAAS